MASKILRKLLALDLEEKILNGASLVAFICVFFPWIGGEWLGGKIITYSGLGFFTSFIGIFILLLHLFLLLITLIPLTGGATIVSRRNKDIVRLWVSVLATILTVSVWSVLTKFTFEFSRLEIHFGLYGTMIASLVTALYSFLLFQEGRRGQVHDLFSHGDTQRVEVRKRPETPTPGDPENHRIHR